MNEYSGHEHEKYIIKSCFSFDDAYVASGSEDNQVLIWDLVEVRRLQWICIYTQICATLVSGIRNVKSTSSGSWQLAR